MSQSWTEVPEPKSPPISILGWLRVLRRGLPVLVVLCLGLTVHGLIRLVERPLFHARRPVSPYVTQGVCRLVLWLLGITVRRHGLPMTQNGAIVANHSSWLDIFVLNACARIYFVAKAEVRGWPGIGWLARATGTVFIRRDRRDAKTQVQLFHERLKLGHKLLFFPEGTSTDNQRVLPFKTTLFAPFLTDEIRTDAAIQPVSIAYHAPEGQDPSFYGWWGDMTFGAHALKVLATRRNGSVDVVFGDPLPVTDYTDRKRLAADLETRVRAGFNRFALKT